MRMESKVHVVIDCLNSLVKVDSGVSGSEFARILLHNLQSFRSRFLVCDESSTDSSCALHDTVLTNYSQMIESGDITNIYDTYTDMCLDLLTELKKDINTEASVEGCGLSIEEMNTVLRVVQLVIGFNVIPNLSAGVGLPLSQCVTTLSPAVVNSICKDQQSGSGATRKVRLFKCVKVLVEQLQYVYASIMSKHLMDIVASLLQIMCEPNDSNRHDEINVDELIQESRVMLQKIISDTHQPLIFRVILTLIGIGGSDKNSAAENSDRLKCPKWLLKVCGNITRNRLMQPTGIYSIFQAMLDMFDNASDWKHCEVMSKIIVHTPNVNPDAQRDYFAAISKQVLSILDEASMSNVGLIKLCTSIIWLMTNVNHDLSEALIWKPLYKPILSCCTSDSVVLRDDGDVVVGGESLSHTITTLYRLYVTGITPPTSHLLHHLDTVLEPLFVFWATLCRDNSSTALASDDDRMRQQLEHILLEYMGRVGVRQAAEQLYQVIVCKCQNCMLPSVTLSTSAEGYRVVYRCDIQSAPQDVMDNIVARQTLITNGIGVLVKTIDNDNIGVVLFMRLLEHSGSRDNVVDAKGLRPSDAIAANKGTVDREQVYKWSTNLHVTSLLSSLIREIPIDKLVEQDIQALLRFVTIVIGNEISHVEECVGGQHRQGGGGDHDLLRMCLLLVCMVCVRPLDSDERLLADNLLLHINKLANMEEVIRAGTIKELLDTTRIVIATHGSGESVERLAADFDNWLTSGRDTASDTDRVPVDAESSASTSDAKPEQLTTSKELAPAVNTSNPVSASSQKRSFQDAWSRLNDDLLPVKAAGCLAIGRLVSQGDSEAIAKLSDIIDILLEYMRDDDSYLYLAAINGMSTIADSHPQRVLTPLLNMYTGTADDSVQVRVKVGEVLVKVSKNLGEAVVKYGDEFVTAFLRTARAGDVTLRVSSLSNLGEVCRHLKYSLGRHVAEVVHCALSMLRSRECEERRACVSLLHDLLHGVDRHTLLQVQHVLSDVHRALRVTYQQDPDPVVRVHTQLALQQLNVNMRDALIPDEQQQLVKKISVLDFF